MRSENQIVGNRRGWKIAIVQAVFSIGSQTFTTTAANVGHSSTLKAHAPALEANESMRASIMFRSGESYALCLKYLRSYRPRRLKNLASDIRPPVSDHGLAVRAAGARRPAFVSVPRFWHKA